MHFQGGRGEREKDTQTHTLKHTHSNTQTERPKQRQRETTKQQKKRPTGALTTVANHTVRTITCSLQSPREVRTLSTYLQAGCTWVFCWLAARLTSQQIASVSPGRICSDNFTCCHTETEVANQTFYLTQSQYTDTGPTSPSADPIMPGA